MEEQTGTAILHEMKRQSEISAEPEVRQGGNHFRLNGPIDVDAIVMAAAGPVVGGP